MRVFTAEKEEKLSRFLGRVFPELSYKYLRLLLRKKDIKIDGKRVSDDVSVYEGAEVCVYAEEDKLFSFRPNIVYQDDNLIIVAKPRGMSSEEYAERLQKHLDCPYLELAHRLDTNTEGLLMLAFSEEIENALEEGLKKGYVTKNYIALCAGKMSISGVKKAYLKKDGDAGIVRVSDKKSVGAEEIITEVTPLEYVGKNTLVGITLHTGKTHQIRAHMAFLGYPVIGDPKYGKYEINRESGAKTQRLSACKLTFGFPSKSPLNYLNSVKAEIAADFCNM